MKYIGKFGTDFTLLRAYLDAQYKAEYHAHKAILKAQEKAIAFKKAKIKKLQAENKILDKASNSVISKSLDRSNINRR